MSWRPFFISLSLFLKSGRALHFSWGKGREMTNRNAVRRLSRFGDVADGRASFHKFQEFTTSMEFLFLSLFDFVSFYSIRVEKGSIDNWQGEKK